MESGVIQFVVPDGDTTTTLEHTFASAHHAAQFQHDILGYQIAGPQIVHLFHSLELVHRGSLAYIGSEPVLHGGGLSATATGGGVAWDDVLRCLPNRNVMLLPNNNGIDFAPCRLSRR